MRGERIQVRNFEEVGSLLKSEKDPVVKKEGEQLGMYLVYLPPYSPDLNPIEFIWKSIKRRFSRLAASLSFAKSWI